MREAGRIDQLKDGYFRDRSHLFILILSFSFLAYILSEDKFKTLVVVYISNLIIPLFCIYFVFLSAIALTRQEKGPLRDLATTLNERGLQAVLSAIAFVVGLATYTTFKVGIPQIVPFYADPFLSDFDVWLHGDYPWKIAHWLVPSNLAGAVNILYNVVWHGFWLALIVYADISKNNKQATRFLVAQILTLFLVGIVMATIFSSSGPLYYEYFYNSARYSVLKEIIYSNEDLSLLRSYSTLLLASYQSGHPEIGSGISAAPSIHVAIATLNALFLGTINRWLGVIAWLFAAIIQFGSVYTGWHYAIDGYISIVAALIIWWLAGRLCAMETGRGTTTKVMQPT